MNGMPFAVHFTGRTLVFTFQRCPWNFMGSQVQYR